MKILIRAIVSFFVFIVDVVYGNRPYPRFYLLETIARVPYFSFLSVLHLYETLGFWRKADWLKVHEAELKSQPAPQIAINYYRDGDLYMFDEFQTTPGREFRRPKVDNLYDVFMNIRDDESEHVKTMIALQQPGARLTFHSPHTVVELMPMREDKPEILASTMSYLKDNIET